MNFRLDILHCISYSDIREKLFAVMDRYGDLLPSDKSAGILLKPNLNSNMNALTGNTTDLRILSVLIQYLKAQGYKNILIAEGTNSGFYRNNIGVIARLKVDRLTRYHGVRYMDLNYAKPHEIEFCSGIKAQIARECVQADFLINLPKLKTHFEMGMSVCLKNLMGCLVGQENKKKTHENLAENIIRLNQQLRPHLHIVDGLIAMEGLGPTRGTPVRMDTILVGTDPYLLDLVCARLAGFDYRRIGTLALAEKKGMLTPAHHRYLKTLELADVQRRFAPPKAGPLASFIHSPKRQRFFLKIRRMRLFEYLAATQWFGRLLFLTGLRQDVFCQQEMDCRDLTVDSAACNRCGLCTAVCPLGIDLDQRRDRSDNDCLRCLYCYSICPQAAVCFHGEKGFFQEQLNQYDSLIRALYHDGN